MKKCIFCCVFTQEKYVDMFYLLLESVFIYGNLDDNTHILVYTSTNFMNIIKQSHLFNAEKVKFEINDSYDDIDKACKARLDLFKFKYISMYEKILYLDTDILIKDDINKVFDVCKEDILYVLEEGTIDDSHVDYWGNVLFGDEVNNYSDKTAFTSGILLFKNCEKMKELFCKINEDIINRPYFFSCYDQPYIIYNAFKYNLHNNKDLKSLVVNNDYNIHSDKVIHHFPGVPGYYERKIEKMTVFLNNIKKYTFIPLCNLYLHSLYTSSLPIKTYPRVVVLNVKTSNIPIPKVLFQTNKTIPDTYVLELINSMLSSEWKYEFYNDDDVIQFFINNPIMDLQDIVQKYNSIKNGSHRADLFRYYYLYINGGFFMDSDAMLYANIDTIVKDYNFVSVNSSCHPGTIFQGILGTSPKNEIIKRALYKAYNTDPDILKDNYHYFCKQLYDIIKETDFGYNIKLYQERRINPVEGDDILDGDILLFKHYWLDKIIPNITKITNWNYYNQEELNDFDYRVLTAYDIPNKLIRMGPKEDGGYVIADGFEYDLLISCGIANDIRFEDDFLDSYNIKCLAFDGTINSFPSHRNNMEWISKNIGYLNTEKTTNLKEYIQNNKRIFLKMDIEGSEFNWLDSMSEVDLDCFSQIVIEYHWPFDIYRMNMLKKLNKTHYIIHIHGNNGRYLYNIHNISLDYNDIDIPEVFEVTYVNKRLFNKPLKKIHKNYPIDGIDYGNHPNQDIKQLEFYIPNDENSVFIGSSIKNTKTLKLKKKGLLGHNLLNRQNPTWKDRFDIEVNNDEIVVKRLDLDCAWGQKMCIPIKYNKILVYNGFPFHYEMIGFILDFSNKYNIEVDLVLKYQDNSWIDVYKSKYNFDVLESLPTDLDHYLFLMLLTDDDMSFPNNRINENIVCIDHYYKNRRENIKYHIPITSFGEHINLYALPVFEYINYEDKINSLNKKSRPIISFIGNSTLPTSIDSLSFIVNLNDFDIYIINKNIPQNYINLPNTFLFENISANELFTLLTESTYICYIPNNTENANRQKNCQAISGCIPMSFTIGCKLIMPKEMNRFLKLKSIVEYSYEDKIILDKKPSLIETFNEREKILNIRDKTIFDLKHMKMFLQHKDRDYNYSILENKTYTWETSYIKFLDNFRMDAFGEGHYKFIDKQNIIAYFGGREHNITFNNDYTEFSSIRRDDSQIVSGKISN